MRGGRGSSVQFSFTVNDQDVCPSYQPKVIWHEAILDVLRNKPSFINMWTLKIHLKNLEFQKLNVINKSAMSHMTYLFWFLIVFNFLAIHFDSSKIPYFVSFFWNSILVSEFLSRFLKCNVYYYYYYYCFFNYRCNL